MTVTMSDCEEDGPATYLALNAMIRDQKKTSIFSFLERADEGWQIEPTFSKILMP